MSFANKPFETGSRGRSHLVPDMSGTKYFSTKNLCCCCVQYHVTTSVIIIIIIRRQFLTCRNMTDKSLQYMSCSVLGHLQFGITSLVKR